MENKKNYLWGGVYTLLLSGIIYMTGGLCYDSYRLYEKGKIEKKLEGIAEIVADKNSDGITSLSESDEMKTQIWNLEKELRKVIQKKNDYQIVEETVYPEKKEVLRKYIIEGIMELLKKSREEHQMLTPQQTQIAGKYLTRALEDINK